jgi:hypothetical protein
MIPLGTEAMNIVIESKTDIRQRASGRKTLSRRFGQFVKGQGLHGIETVSYVNAVINEKGGVQGMAIEQESCHK